MIVRVTVVFVVIPMIISVISGFLVISLRPVYEAKQKQLALLLRGKLLKLDLPAYVRMRLERADDAEYKDNADPLLASRAKFLMSLSVAFAMFLITRIVVIQVFHGGQLAARALAQRTTAVLQVVKRGEIRTYDGATLAYSDLAYRLYAIPNAINQRDQVIRALASATGLPSVVLREKLNQRKQLVLVADHLTHDTAAKIEASDFTGVLVVGSEEGFRRHPLGRLAITTIGVTGLDEDGLTGLEFQYDSTLRGSTGKLIEEVDEFGRPLPFRNSVKYAPRAIQGADVTLTLNARLQEQVERLAFKVCLRLRTRQSRSLLWTLIPEPFGPL
jgi:cell division protein FtsI/penicillin-binding protein 2